MLYEYSYIVMVCPEPFHVEGFFTKIAKILNLKLIINDHMTHSDAESVFAIRYRMR